MQCASARAARECGLATSLRQLQRVQQRLEARISAQRFQHRRELDERDPTISLPIGTLQPLKRLILLATPGAGLRDLVRLFVRVPGYQLRERLLRCPRVPEAMLGHDDPGQTE